MSSRPKELAGSVVLLLFGTTMAPIATPVGTDQAAAAADLEAVDKFPLPTLDSKPYDLDIDCQGRVVVTESAASQIAVLTPGSGVVVEHPTPTPDAGPRYGTLQGCDTYWFAEMNSNALALLTLSNGTVTEFPTSGNGTEPRGLAVGADGRIWVALSTPEPGEPDLIGAFSPGSGQWILVPLPEPQARVLDVLATGDGKILVADFLHGGIYEVNPSSLAVRALPIPPISEPVMMVEDRLGKVWVTAHSTTTYLVEIAADRATSRIYTNPQSGLLPYAIDIGPCDSVWFTEQLGNKASAFFPAAGSFGQRLAIPHQQSYPFAMRFDASWDLWVAGSNSNAVYRFPRAELGPIPCGTLRVEISPGNGTTFEIGSTRRFSARGFDEQGLEIPGAWLKAEWSVSPTSVAQVNESGQVTGVGAGSANLSCVLTVTTTGVSGAGAISLEVVDPRNAGDTRQVPGVSGLEVLAAVGLAVIAVSLVLRSGSRPREPRRRGRHFPS